MKHFFKGESQDMVTGGMVTFYWMEAFNSFELYFYYILNLSLSFYNIPLQLLLEYFECFQYVKQFDFKKTPPSGYLC